MPRYLLLKHYRGGPDAAPVTTDGPLPVAVTPRAAQRCVRDGATRQRGNQASRERAASDFRRVAPS
jgi:hypothetical protein